MNISLSPYADQGKTALGGQMLAKMAPKEPTLHSTPSQAYGRCIPNKMPNSVPLVDVRGFRHFYPCLDYPN